MRLTTFVQCLVLSGCFASIGDYGTALIMLTLAREIGAAA
jgi:hypothetical protein